MVGTCLARKWRSRVSHASGPLECPRPAIAYADVASPFRGLILNAKSRGANLILIEVNPRASSVPAFQAWGRDPPRRQQAIRRFFALSVGLSNYAVSLSRSRFFHRSYGDSHSSRWIGILVQEFFPKTSFIFCHVQTAQTALQSQTALQLGTWTVFLSRNPCLQAGPT
jgi:hypothetical protein